MFLEFSVTTDLTVRKRTRAFDYVLSTSSLSLISLSHVIIQRDCNTCTLTVLKVSAPLASHTLPVQGPATDFWLA